MATVIDFETKSEVDLKRGFPAEGLTSLPVFAAYGEKKKITFVTGVTVMQHRVLLCLLLSSLLLTGCAPLVAGGVSKSSYGVYQDKRLMDTMVADNNICSYIRGEVAKKEAWKSLSLGIYSYYGKVFLVGDITDKKIQEQVTRIATKTQGVRSVTSHWFPPARGENNMLLATKLRSNLLGTDGLVSSRVDTEVNAGRVVLLGVVDSEEEKKRAVRAARQTSGVTSVTSYLMLPQ